MRLLASLSVAVLFVAAACSSQPRASDPPSVSTFQNDIMSFEYPGAWNALVPETGDPALVLLSSEPLASTEPRIDKLNADGVYIAWTEESVAPVATPNPSIGAEVEVGGRPGNLRQDAADGDCAGLDGDQLLTVQIDSPGSRPDVLVQACVRGPNFELISAAIAGMLASVEWKD